MLASLVVFSIISLQAAFAAGYISVTDGYRIIMNQGLVNLNILDREVVIDTSKATQDFFIPSKTTGEIDSYLGSELHSVVQGSGEDTTPPVITVESVERSSKAPAYSVVFSVNENGTYTTAYSTEPEFEWGDEPQAIEASVSTEILVGDAEDTTFYYSIWAWDENGNEARYDNSLYTSWDDTPPVLSDITDITPGDLNPPQSDIIFFSDSVGEFQIVYANEVEGLTEPQEEMWLEMVADINTGAAGDGEASEFYYIIYARDASLNTSDSGVMTAGAPPGGGVSATGGDVSYINDGGIDYVVHTFTTSGTFSVSSAGEVEYLVVGGGGGVRNDNYAAGGGGGGGVLTGTVEVSEGNHTITVGAGGTGGLNSTNTALRVGNKGGDSSFGEYATAIGGGANGGSTVKNGGCGGGASVYSGSVNANGTGTAGQGYDGGLGYLTRAPGGGGGAGQIGNPGIANYKGGAGGNGVASSITGTSTYYGGGGGASGYSGGYAGAGGLGGGAPGRIGTATASQYGVDGLGGGAGGATSYTTGKAADGGDGVVIIRYVAPQNV